ncbi:unnamed protein product [Schistosoma curassoni]|uniref:DNA-directed RNA polymerase n=1 Tax=Schistosoma curassoni TaxID=6186 RepID=A0A183KM96_9TREM|nr:unnamed protein product [Schistosoma curassoni]
MKSVLEGSSYCVLRTRLCCQVIRSNVMNHIGNNNPDIQNTSTASNCSSENQSQASNCSNDISSRSSSPDTEYHFLNDLVIDRGLSPFICDLLIKVNGREVTTVEGDATSGHQLYFFIWLVAKIILFSYHTMNSAGKPL